MLKKILPLLFFILLITLSDLNAQCNITGVITTANPTLPGMRLFRDGITSNCTAPKLACPGMTAPTGVYYATHTISNASNISKDVVANVSVDPTNCTGTNQIVVAAYLSSFDPFNICSNYVGDLGNSPNPSGSFCFIMPPNSTFDIVIMQANTGAACAGLGYSVNVCSALPVELISFNVTQHNDYNLLAWQTSSEENNSHFNIECSTNGEAFRTIAQVEGSKHSNELNDYTYFDENVVFGKTIYRLKQIDIDGQFAYSQSKYIQHYKTDGIEPILVNSLLNNNDRLHIIFPNRYDSHFSLIRIINPNGQTIIEKRRNTAEDELLIDCSKLSKGLYILSIQEDGIIKQFKFVKQ